jgi:hypothetical protein
MKIKSRKDFVSGLAMIVTGVAFAIGATNYKFGTNHQPGPGYFPFGLGIILSILGLIVLVTSLKKGPANGDPIGKFPWRPLFFVVGSVVFFASTLTIIGFVISFPLMIIFCSFGGPEFRWRDALLNATLLTVFSYLVFIAGLKLTIPVWPYFFN